MYKKLKEIFNWFQQKAIRRMNLKNVLNEYYYLSLIHISEPTRPY